MTIYISVPTFSKAVGRSPQIIGRYIGNGIIPLEARKKFGKRWRINLERGKEALDNNLDPTNRKENKPKRNPTEKPTEDEKQKAIESAGVGGMSFNEARRLDQQYKAGLRKLEYDQKRGALIEADQVKRDAAKAARIVKKKVTLWPGLVAPLVAVETDIFKVEQILKQECNQLLEEISTEVKE